MTADAKVGLLLGLFFIALIAFLVHGLPPFIRQENALPADAAITTPSGPDMILDQRVADVVHRLNPSAPVAPAPKQDPVVLDPASPRPPVVQFETPRLRPEEIQVPAGPIEIKNSDLNGFKQVPTVVTARSQTHAVKSGESLAVIAQQYYGKEDGNRFIVIQKLYEANTKVLKSADKVFVGDKLTIPPLEQLLGIAPKPAQAAAAEKPESKKGMLEKFSETFERVKIKKAPGKPLAEYVVRENDSLWSIAQNHLGDGNRYKEIARLNKIKNVDTVPCGARLKIPAR